MDNSQVGTINKPQSQFFSLIFDYYLLNVVGKYWAKTFPAPTDFIIEPEFFLISPLLNTYTRRGCFETC